VIVKKLVFSVALVHTITLLIPFYVKIVAVMNPPPPTKKFSFSVNCTVK
jgi:hypothetical protein